MTSRQMALSCHRIFIESSTFLIMVLRRATSALIERFIRRNSATVKSPRSDSYDLSLLDDTLADAANLCLDIPRVSRSYRMLIVHLFGTEVTDNRGWPCHSPLDSASSRDERSITSAALAGIGLKRPCHAEMCQLILSGGRH